MRQGIALAVLLAFGCATVRVPAGSIEEGAVPLQGAVAEPQIELWLESGEQLSEARVAAARGQAREALEEALRSRAIVPSPLGATDPVLLVRERGVSRTASRRRDQVAATVGMVVGIVVVVAVVVALAASGKGSSKSAPSKAPATPAKASAPVARATPAPRPHAHPIAPPPPPQTVASASHLPAPWTYGTVERYPWLWVGFDFRIAPHPMVLRPADPLDAPAPPDDGEDSPPPEPPPLQVPPPPDFDVSDRGFFSGDDSVLEVDLLDRDTGKLLWSRTVHGGDPLDKGDVRRLVNDALDGAAWAPRLRRP